MRFEIEHLTRYRYSRPVTLGRHTLRLTPRCDARQRLLADILSITPEPSQLFDFVDAWGNATRLAVFEGATDLLEIHARMQVLTGPSASLDLPDGELTLPLDYARETKALQPYLEPLESAALLQEFTHNLRRNSGGRLLPLLELLNASVAKFYRHEVRLEGPAYSPAETLRKKAGVCRDLALLFIAACRHLGIASRFVSGYQLRSASADSGRRYLHAWAEVYLPNLGWRGYDQTHAAPTADAHVAIACGPTQAFTMPVEGGFSYLGEPPECILENDLQIYTGAPARTPGRHG